LGLSISLTSRSRFLAATVVPPRGGYFPLVELIICWDKRLYAARNHIAIRLEIQRGYFGHQALEQRVLSINSTPIKHIVGVIIMGNSM